MEKSPRILFIEESEAFVQQVIQTVQSHGFTPFHQQTNNLEILQIALQKTSWDIAICSNDLHNTSVFEVIRILKNSDEAIPCIVLSDSFEEDVASKAICAGASHYLLKGQLNLLTATIKQQFQEVTLRRTKQQSEAAMSHLAALVESCEDAIISTDLQGRVLTWNAGAEKVYGYSATEAQGELLTRLIPPHNNPLLTIPLEHQLNQVIDCRQVMQQRKTGELVDILFTVSLIRTVENQIVGFAIVARDISDRQIIQRMKDEFISVVNHELRTPLASLQGSIELLLTGKLGNLSDRGLRMLEIAASNIDRLVQLTSRILDLEALISGQGTILKQVCDVSDLVHQSINDLQPIATQQQIQFFLASRSIQVWLDPDRIRQVLHHLLINAVQFSQVGGRIWVEIELHTTGNFRNLQSPHVLIKVKDEGRGIPADKLESIFGQFQQADASDARSHGGVGLGLAICRSIIHQHQGSLWAESVLGRGSTFYLALPLQRVAVPTL